MPRTSKIADSSVPPSVLREVERLAKAERRTKSELFREMLRVYQRHRAQNDRAEEQWVMDLIAEAKAEHAKHPMSVQEMLDEQDRLAKEGAAQAKKLGIKSRDVVRLIHEYRRSRQA